MPSACLIGFVLAALCVVQCHSAKLAFSSNIPKNESKEYYYDKTEWAELSVSEIIEKANKNAGKGVDDAYVLHGDILVPTSLQNADPCTARGCLWPKSTDGKVYVAFTISPQYSGREREVITNGLKSIEAVTCIRFRQRSSERAFLNIVSQNGCFSFVGMRGHPQTLSLSRNGCVFPSVVQHEVLHALGFNHEQTRSDRDQHVRILLQNVIQGMEFNFNKIQTNNLGTPYDYNSVMHYERFAFSKNRQPTIVPIPNANAVIGRATKMSNNDITRVNKLYQCS